MESHEEAVRRFADAFERRDIGAAFELLDPEAELLPIRAQLEGATYRGHDGYRDLVADFDQDWEGLRLVFEELRESGDRVVASGRMVARGRASGVDLDVPLALLYRFSGDKIVRIESFTDPAEALRAAGIDE